ncbi:MAG TPA: DUF2924 domain-containing protein [Alphaproteobacteria bacterium]|nr:DUF2924 domain-containing protein [Alphaproteobacteria bacterium]
MRRDSNNKVTRVPMSELRREWAAVWGCQPHRYIRREMLEKSLEFKQRQLRGEGLTVEQQKRLDNLIAQYKRNPDHFDQVSMSSIKPGTRLVRVWKGKRYNVIIRAGGYEFDGKFYTSLSQIASDITGTRWNGWVFFGLKERGG